MQEQVSRRTWPPSPLTFDKNTIPYIQRLPLLTWSSSLTFDNIIIGKGKSLLHASSVDSTECHCQRCGRPQILGHGNYFKMIANQPSNPGTLRRLLLTELELSAAVKILQPCFMWPEILLCKHWPDWQCYQTIRWSLGPLWPCWQWQPQLDGRRLQVFFVVAKGVFGGEKLRMFHRDYNDPNWSCFSLVIFYIDFPKHYRIGFAIQHWNLVDSTSISRRSHL